LTLSNCLSDCLSTEHTNFLLFSIQHPKKQTKQNKSLVKQTKHTNQKIMGWHTESPLQVSNPTKNTTKNTTKKITSRGGGKAKTTRMAVGHTSYLSDQSETDHVRANADIIQQLKAVGAWQQPTTTPAETLRRAWTSPISPTSVPETASFPVLPGTKTRPPPLVFATKEEQRVWGSDQCGYPDNELFREGLSPSPIDRSYLAPVFPNATEKIVLATDQELVGQAFEDWCDEEELDTERLYRAMVREYQRVGPYLEFLDEELFLDIEWEHDDWYVPVNLGPTDRICVDDDVRYLVGGGCSGDGWVGGALIPMVVSDDGRYYGDTGWVVY
jgi:hypothetical protein